MAWKASGQYLETCSCDYICLCTPANFGVPLKRDCFFAVAFHIEEGSYESTPLDGLNFIVIGCAPGPTMLDGNIDIGVLTDERASAEQQQALVSIARGEAGGPWAALAPLYGSFLGAEPARIEFQGAGLSWSFSVPGLVDQALEGLPSPVKEGEPLIIDNTGHPASPRLALAKATRSHLHAMGLDWDDVSGGNNAHFARFNWSG